MKFLPAFIGLAAGVLVGWIAVAVLELHWLAGVTVGFAVFVAVTRLIEHRLRATAERRMMRAFERAKR
jgi:hypothetical protein